MQLITQENLHLILPKKIGIICTLIAENNQMSLQEAIQYFYKSKAYRLLEDENTKLWYESGEQIFANYFQNTLKHYQNGPNRSKLAPHTQLIKSFSRQGMTLKAIACELEKLNCKTTVQNISKFLKRQKNQKRR